MIKRAFLIPAALTLAALLISCSYDVPDVIGDGAFVTGVLTNGAGEFSVTVTLEEYSDITSYRCGSIVYYDEDGDEIFSVHLTKSNVSIASGETTIFLTEGSAAEYRAVMRLFAVSANSILTREVSDGTAYTSYGGEPTVYVEADAETGIPYRIYGGDFLCFSVIEWQRCEK